MNSGRLRVLLLMVCDALCLGASWILAAWVSARIESAPLDFEYVYSRWGFLVIFWALNIFTRLYHGNPLYPSAPLAPVEEFRRLTLTTLGTTAVFFAYLAFYGKASPLPSYAVIIAAGINIIFAPQGRNILRYFLKKWNIAQIPVVLLGPKKETKRLERIFRHSIYFGLSVKQVFTKAEDAQVWAREHKVKHCISCQPLRVFRASLRTLLGWFSIIISLPEPSVFPIAMTRPVEFSGYGGIEMANQLRQKGIVAAKRVVEASLAVFGVVILFVPGLLISIVLILVYRDFNIFYRTQRLGRRGVPFTIWKFRSMYTDADARLAELLENNPELREEWETTGKLACDPRITSIGKMLRKTSLDEVPQLFNVLRGDMALIGPRPIVEREVPYYGEHYLTAFSVKPGITGLWQVSGRSGVDYEARVALDLYYAQNWNLWMDCWILLKTVAVVLIQRGAC